MSTPATDYNQQLLAYLQTWRQLLDQWMAMAAGLPFPTPPSVMPTAPSGGYFMPPTAPFMPPSVPFMPPTASVPPMPPAPADYTQQLFSYLQAWRQYLEQMTGAKPGAPPASTAQPANASENPPPTTAVIPVPRARRMCPFRPATTPGAGAAHKATALRNRRQRGRRRCWI